MHRPLTIIESPYTGDLERNLRYLKRCLRDSHFRGEIPFASHGFFTTFLHDLSPIERQAGINHGYEFWRFAHKVVFCLDYGMSPGMVEAQLRLIKQNTLNSPDPKPHILWSEIRFIGLNEEPNDDPAPPTT